MVQQGLLVRVDLTCIPREKKTNSGSYVQEKPDPNPTLKKAIRIQLINFFLEINSSWIIALLLKAMREGDISQMTFLGGRLRSISPPPRPEYAPACPQPTFAWNPESGGKAMIPEY